MTRYLASEDKPEGFKLEDILSILRKDIMIRCLKIADDERVEAREVLANNMKVLNLLTESITIAEDSTRILDKSFGPSRSAQGGMPRIGKV